MREPLFEYRLSLAGFETRALEIEGDGPPLLLLHGWSDSADTWRAALALLARKGRRAIALDMPGYGEASQLQQGPILPQLDRFAAAALRHVVAEAGEPAIVSGNSLGGCVALRLAERHDLDELAGIVPVAPAGLDMAAWIGIVQGAPLLRALLASPLPVPGVLTEQVIGRLYRMLAFADPRRADANAVRSFTRHLRERERVLRLLANARQLRPELRAPFELHRLRCPVLILWGDRDRLVFATGARQVIERVPDARFELLEGVGHCPQVEVPERYVEQLLDFADQPLVSVA